MYEKRRIFFILIKTRIFISYEGIVFGHLMSPLICVDMPREKKRNGIIEYRFIEMLEIGKQRLCLIAVRIRNTMLYRRIAAY